MGKIGIFIVSKSRAGTITRSLPAAISTGLPVTLFVEPAERNLYEISMDRAGIRKQGYKIIEHVDNNIGVAAARKSALDLAYKQGVEYMLMVDDDVVVPKNLIELARWLDRHPRRPGCAAYFQIYKHFAKIEENTGVHRHNGSMGRRCFAVRPAQLIELGCFETKIATNDDTDMVLRLFRAGYLPWAIHSDVVAGSLAQRYGPGGISSNPGTKDEKEWNAYKTLCREFGQEFFSFSKNGSMRVLWKKLYKEYAPNIEYHTLRQRRDDE